MIDEVFQQVRIGKHVEATRPLAQWLKSLDGATAALDAQHIANQALGWDSAGLHTIASTLIRHLLRAGRPDAALAIYERLRQRVPDLDARFGRRFAHPRRLRRKRGPHGAGDVDTPRNPHLPPAPGAHDNCQGRLLIGATGSAGPHVAMLRPMENTMSQQPLAQPERCAQALRQYRGARRAQSRGESRRDAGPARPERRRQVHRHFPAARPAESRPRLGRAVRRRAAVHRCAPPHRRHDAGNQSSRRHAPARADRAGRELLPEPVRRAGRDQAARHREDRRPSLRQAVRRPETPGAVRHGDCRPARAAVPRRADGGSRCAGARRACGRCCAT